MSIIFKNPCLWPANSCTTGSTVKLQDFVIFLQTFHHPRTIFNKVTANERTPIGEIEIQTISIDTDKFSRDLQACTKAKDLRRGLALHCQAIKTPVGVGFVSVWNKLLSMYGQCGQILHSRQLFDKMTERDTVSFNTLISAYIRHGHYCEALHLYVQMRADNLEPNHISFSTLLTACAALAAPQLIKQFHAQVIKFGSNYDVFVGSSLVDSYAKCLKLKEAKCAFDEIAELDLISWNIMISGFAHNGCQEQAFELFSKLQRAGIKPDSFTLTSLLMVCSEQPALDQGKQLHGCAVKASLDSETPIGNALLTMYSKSKAMDYATQLFLRIPEPNIISWTAMIAGFVQNGLSKQAIGFYETMLREGVKENEFSFTSILPAYGNLASLQRSKQVHTRIVKSGHGADISIGNALIDTYSKCGSIVDAQLVFKTMENHDLVSWTVMIGGYGQHGNGADALRIFDAMKREGFTPDGITFLGVLSACSHGGLVDEGLKIFQSMRDFRSIELRIEHYTCIVDMLGRAGRLKEAEVFIREMSIELEASAWEALLGACMIHGEMELGWRSAEKVMELEPERDGPYVLLSNIYAERGMWEEKEKVRRRLEARGLRKEAGWSWVEVPGMSRNLNGEMGVA